MKTKNTLRSLAFSLAAFFLFSGNNAKAQMNVPFHFSNTLNCAVKVFWETLDITSCTSVCDSGFLTVPAGGGNTILSISSTCSSNPNEACDLRITVIDIGGTAVTMSPFLVLGTTPNMISLPVVNGCTNASSFVDFAASDCNFH